MCMVLKNTKSGCLIAKRPFPEDSFTAAGRMTHMGKGTGLGWKIKEGVTISCTSARPRRAIPKVATERTQSGIVSGTLASYADCGRTWSSCTGAGAGVGAG